MPFVRVGIFPGTTPDRKDGKQHSASQQGGRGNKANRQKGITMEDLKKQTAIRLAQEQQQQSHVAFPATTTTPLQQPSTKESIVSNGRSDPLPFDPFGFLKPRNSSIGDNVVADANTSAIPQQHHHRAPRQSPAVAHHIPVGQDPVTSATAIATATSAVVSSGRYNDQSSTPANKSGRKKASKPAVRAQTKSLVIAGTSQNTGSKSPNGCEHDRRNHYQRSSPIQGVPVTGQSQSPSKPVAAVEPSPLRQQGTGNKTQPIVKSKLPHGLTVHELKEMTKARLQAEAAERHEKDKNRVFPYEPRTITPGGEGARDKNMCNSMGNVNLNHPDTNMQHMMRHQMGGSVDSRGPIPSLVQIHPLSLDQHQMAVVRQPPQVSPLPPGMQGYRTINSAGGHSFVESCARSEYCRSPFNIIQQEARPEPWETASIASHTSTAASEYLGSESAFSSGRSGFASQSGTQSGTADDACGLAFGRSRSYPAPNKCFSGAPEMPSYESTSTFPPSSNGPFFEVAVGAAPNRKRASTLSPRPGLTLLHEDWPVYSGQDLGIPTFSSVNRPPPGLAPSNNSFSSPGPNSMRFAGVIGGPVSDTPNRPRTSSAASLPPISHTAEEFALDRNTPASYMLGGAAINEDILVSDTDSFLGRPILQGGNNSSNDIYRTVNSGLTSVFRDTSSALGLRMAPGGLGAVDVSSASGHNTSMHNQARSRVDSLDSFYDSRMHNTAMDNQARARVYSLDSFNDSRIGPAWDGSISRIRTNDAFSPRQGLTDDSACADMLSGDWASILKLSGAEESRADGDCSGSEDISRMLSGNDIGVGMANDFVVQDGRQL